MNTPQSQSRAATVFGLLVALFALPAVIVGFRLAFGEVTSTRVFVLKEIAAIAVGVLVLGIVVKGERLPLSSIGLGTRPWKSSVGWGLLGVVFCAAGLAASLGLAKLLGWPFGAKGFGFEPPLWAVGMAVFRAGTVEEICYRGFAIERLRSLTGNRALAIGLPLVLFAAFHYRQGYAGILIAFVLGAILTAMYVRRRDLNANIVTHFVVDFIPNILLPLVSG